MSKIRGKAREQIETTALARKAEAVNLAQQSEVRDSPLTEFEKESVAGWLATPRPLRNPKTAKALAAQLGIRAETISRWRRDPQLTLRVFEEVKERFASDLPEIVAAVVERAKGGDVGAARMILELCFDWRARAQAALEIQATVNYGDPFAEEEVKEEELPTWARTKAE